MTPHGYSRELTSLQRDYLIDHACGPRPIIVSEDFKSRNALLSRGLIRTPAHSARPTYTELTELGRKVLCCVLGAYADALVRAEQLLEAPQIVLKKAPSISGPFRPIVESRALTVD